MAEAATLQENYLRTWDRLSHDLAGQQVEWVKHLRNEGKQNFAELGFPSIRDEDWKYTSVKPIERQLFTPSVDNELDDASIDISELSTPGLEPYRAVFINGHFSPDLSDLPVTDGQLHIGGMAEALREYPSQLEPYLGQLVPDASHGFSALNAAFLQDGAFVRIGPGCIVDRPIELVFLVIDGASPVLASPRNLIVAESGARASVIERYIGPDNTSYLTNAVTEVVALGSARLGHYKLVLEGSNAFHVGGLYIQQKESSLIDSFVVTLGGRIVRNELRCSLSEPDSECNLLGLYIATGRQHVDNFTHVDHRVPDCTSREVYRGVLDGRGRAVFHGRVVVHPDAQGTNAEQENKNLLLSRDAEIDTKPQLEIYADDVKCSHGSTVGQLDEGAVYYLRSRGLDEPAARSLLTYAFANDVLNKMKLEPVHRELEEQLGKRLLHGQIIEGHS